MHLINIVLAAVILACLPGRADACIPEDPPPVPAEGACMFPVDLVGNDGVCDLIAYVEKGPIEADLQPRTDIQLVPPSARDTLVLARTRYQGDEIASTHPVDVVDLSGKVPPGHVVVFHCSRHGQPDSGLAAVAPVSHYLPVNATAAWEVDFQQQVFVETSPVGIVCEMGSGD
ncbi:MAG: hypothetical protein ACOH1P_03810 [Lysobacter sp.]